MDAAEKRRLAAIKAQSVNTFGKNFPIDYQTPTIQRNVKGFSPGDDLHHRAIISVYEPFFTGLTKNETLAMVDELASMGVFTGNNPKNFTAMSDRAEHQGGIHVKAADFGIQLKGDDLRAQGKEVAANGELMPSANEFFDRIRNSTYDQRVKALPLFVKYGQDELDRVLRDEMGYEVPTRQEQKQVYRDLVNAEHNQVIKDSVERKVEGMLDASLPRTGQRRAGAKVEALLSIL